MNMSLNWQRYHDPVASLKTFKSLLDIFQYLHTLGRQDTFYHRPCSHYYKNKKFGVCKKFENFVSTNFLFLQPRSHLRQAKFFVYTETSIKGTLIGHVRERRWPNKGKTSRKKRTCRLAKKKCRPPNPLDGIFELVTVEKILVGEKKSFALELASFWQNFCVVWTGPYLKIITG